MTIGAASHPLSEDELTLLFHIAKDTALRTGCIRLLAKRGLPGLELIMVKAVRWVLRRGWGRDALPLSGPHELRPSGLNAKIKRGVWVFSEHSFFILRFQDLL